MDGLNYNKKRNANLSLHSPDWHVWVISLHEGGGAGGIQDIYRRGLRVNQYYGTSIFLISSKAFLEFSMRGM